MTVAVVTGGSRGRGVAIVLTLSSAGHDVVFSYRADVDAARSVTASGRALGVRADMASEDDLRGLFTAADDIGPLGILVNNAGIVGTKARVDELTSDRVRHVLEVNVVAAFTCARETVRRMSTRHGGEGGVIVNIGSVASRLGSGGQYVDYAASKGAIDTMTIGLAQEVAGEGVRVCCVRPGIIVTDIHASGGDPDRPQRMASSIPLGRPGRPEEIAS